MKKITRLLVCCQLLIYTIGGMSMLNAQEANSQQKLLPIGLQKQLLVDDYVIAAKENIIREYGKAQKIGVVMEPTLPHEFMEYKVQEDGSVKVKNYPGYGGRLSVAWNEQKQIFQMIYALTEGYTCYAESEDGIHWNKPLVSADGKTNFITFEGENQLTFFEVGATIDPSLPWGHPEKYKAAYNGGETESCIGYSADGIHWTGYNDGKPVTYRAADTHNHIIWDSIGKRYLLLTREDLASEGGRDESRATRVMEHAAGNDLMNYPTAWKTISIVNVEDPQHRTTPAGAPLFQMEAMKIWPYENIYFALMNVLTMGNLTGSEAGDQIKFDEHDRPESDVIEYYIATSRDAIHFDQTSVLQKHPFVERGQAYGFDKGIMEPSTEIITVGDEHYIYYTGLYIQHHCPMFENVPSGKVGLAKLPLDRFVSQSAGDQWGTITTQPFVLEGNKLLVNAEALQGEFFVEVLNEKGEPIRPFSADFARHYKGFDNLRLQPRWTFAEDMDRLIGRTIQLRFHLKNAKLYSFQIQNDPVHTDPNEIIVRHVWNNADPEYTKYRIPGMVVTPEGSILTFCEGRKGSGGDCLDIDMVMRRSTDNGRTWSETNMVWDEGVNSCGSPCPFVDGQTGRVYLMMTWGIGMHEGYDEQELLETRAPYLTWSDDDGMTWADPVNLIEFGKDPSWHFLACGPGCAIQLKSEKYKNRIVVPCDHAYRTDKEGEIIDFMKEGFGNHMMLSDDGGKTWRHSEAIRPYGNECQVVELTDGTLLLNMRSYHHMHCRLVSYSHDGGETWSDPEDALALYEPTCEGSILRYGEYQGKTMYLFCNPASVEDRQYLTIKVSFDECQTWTNSKLVTGNKSEYSTMVVLPDGNIGLLFETGRVEDGWSDRGLMFVSFHPDQLFTPGALLREDQIPE